MPGLFGDTPAGWDAPQGLGNTDSWTPPARTTPAPTNMQYGQPPVDDNVEVISLFDENGNIKVGAGPANTQQPASNQQPTSTDPTVLALLQSMQQQQEAQRALEAQRISIETQRLQQQQQQEVQKRASELEAQRLKEQQEFLASLTPQIDEQDIKVSPEDVARYGESAAFIRAEATKQAQKIISGLAPNLQKLAQDQFRLNSELDALKARTASPQASQAGLTPERELSLILRAQVPDFDALTSNPAFQAFRNTPAAAGFNYGQLVDMAYSKGDAGRLVGLLNHFRAGLKGSNGTTQQQSVNYQANAVGNTPPQQRRRALSEAEYNVAYNKYMSGQMDRETFMKIDDQFQTAVLMGNIVN